MITVIIPTRNEEKTVANVIDSVKSFCDEVLVVDGHSTDMTKKISIEHGARFVFDGGKGKGDGIRTGIKNAAGDIIVFIDADGSHDPKDIPMLVKPILDNKTDMVVGCRMTGGSDELYGDAGKYLRFIGSMIITLIINYRWGVRLTDTQNGYRAVRKDAISNVNLEENIFTIEQEMIMKLLRKGYKVANAPAHEYARKAGISGIVISKVWFRYGWSVIKNVFGFSSL